VDRGFYRIWHTFGTPEAGELTPTNIPFLASSAFLVYLVSHTRPMAEVLAPRRKDLALEFARAFVGMTAEPVPLAELAPARSCRSATQPIPSHGFDCWSTQRDAQPPDNPRRAGFEPFGDVVLARAWLIQASGAAGDHFPDRVSFVERSPSLG
jgi:hypothetical protein